MRDWLAAAAERHPQRTALLRPHDDHERLVAVTFERLNQQAAAEAASLRAIGLQPGDRAAVLMDNHARYAALIWGMARAGLTLVPLNTRLSADELRYQADKVGCRLVIADRTTESLALALKRADRPVYSVGALSSPDALPFPAADGRAFLDGALDPDAPAAILFTSGTTGKPKAAVLTWGNFHASAVAAAARIGVQPDDRWLLTIPLFHVGGLSIVYRSALYGTAFVFPDVRGWDGRLPRMPKTLDILAALDREAITLVSLVPTQLYRLLEAGWRPQPALRAALIGGAAADPTLLERALAAGVAVAPTYGLTEAASQVATLPPQRARGKIGTVGQPLDGVQVRIVDEAERDLPAGEIGEIVVRGGMVMRGYLNEPNGRTLRDGALHTGDLGYLDADGDLWLVQRRSDLIVSGGENIYPAEVETALRSHPAVSEACVVGLADAEWGQLPAAAIVLRDDAQVTADDLTRHCIEQLARYKRPRAYRFVEALPMTASGKIKRDAVRALFTPPE